MSTPTLKDAIALAARAHDGQTDKAGAPYLSHVLRVMENAREAGDDEDTQVIAVLHDTLEDTWVTREYLLDNGYSAPIVQAIEALSKLPDEEGTDEGYEKFIRRAAQNPIARTVKIADLKDNMDLSHIENPTDQAFKRRDKYPRALDSLA